MKILAVLLLCCVAAVCHAQSTTTQIDPNSQISGPLLSSNNMLPGVAADGANGVSIVGGLLIGGLPQSTSPICPNGLNGALTTIGCAGGGGSFVALTGDAVSTSSGGATTVKGLNNTLLSSLASGLLYNTAATGVPTIASAAQVNVLLRGLTGCTTATWLLSPQDAQCHAPTTMTYPSSGVPVSTGTAWATSLTVFGSLAGLATAGDPGTVANVPMVSNTAHGIVPHTSGALGTGAFTAAYVLPTATSNTLGGVKPDGTTLTNTSGALSVTYGTTAVSAAAGNDVRITGAMQTTGGSFTGKIATQASATGGAGFSLPPGVAPTSPVNGDCWTTASGMYCQINGATVGPYGTGSSTVWPGTAGLAVYAGGSAWGTSLAAPVGAIIGTTDTQTLTNKTVDGVAPTTMAYLDATSSVQTQLNGKAPVNNPSLTGTVTLPLTGSTQCLHVSTSGVLSGTGSDCGSGGGSFTAGGDLSGSSTSQTVVGIGGHAIAAPTSAGYTYWTGSAWAYQNPSGSGNVNNVGTPTIGQIPVWQSATTLSGVSTINAVQGGVPWIDAKSALGGGAAGNGVERTDCGMSTGSNIVTCTGAAFTSAISNYLCAIQGAGPLSASENAIIGYCTYASPTTLTMLATSGGLAVAPTNTVTNQVFHYGSDDYTALNTCIQTVALGGICYLSPGRYTLSGSIKPGQYGSIIGAGPGVSIIDVIATQGGNYTVGAIGGAYGFTPGTSMFTGVRFSNFEIDNRDTMGSAYNVSNKGIFIQYSQRSSFDHLYIHDCIATCLGADYLYGTSADHNTVVNFGRGAVSTASFTAASNSLGGSGIGVATTNADYGVISDNYISGVSNACTFGNYGIFTEAPGGAGSAYRIHGNVVTNSCKGIGVTAGNSTVVADNVSASNHWNYVVDCGTVQATNGSYVNFSGNTSLNATVDGYLLNYNCPGSTTIGQKGASIVGGKILSSNNSAIHIIPLQAGTTLASLSVVGVDMELNGQSAVFLDGTAGGGFQSISLQGNQFISNGASAGGAANQSAVRIAGNVTNFNATGNTMGNNASFPSNQQYAFYQAASTTITGGQIADNDYYGLATAPFDFLGSTSALSIQSCWPSGNCSYGYVTTDPGYQLAVNGTFKAAGAVQFPNIAASSGTNYVTVDTSGNLSSTAGGAGVTSIDSNTGAFTFSGAVSHTGNAYTFTGVGSGVSSVTGDSVLYSNSASTGAVSLTPISEASNTVFAGPTSGGPAAPGFRALVAADLPGASTPINSSGIGYMFGLGSLTLMGGTTSNSAITPANRVYVCQFMMPATMRFGHVTLVIGTAQASQTMNVGLYSVTGSGTSTTGALLLDSGAISLAATGPVTTTLTPQTFVQGTPLWVAIASTGTTGAISVAALGVGQTGYNTAISAHCGYGANTLSAGALPATLGTLTAVSVFTPAAVWEY